MLEQIIDLDKALLLLLNGSNSHTLDQAMWLYTGKLIWLPLILALIWVICRRGRKEALLVILLVALTATLCDQISSSLFKPLFARYRPSQDPEFSALVKLVNDYRGGMYGFISSHAANSFGLVTFTALLFRNRFYTFTTLLWATINSYSRVYLGVHYPGDIVVGAAVGATIGWICFKLYLLLHRNLYFRGVYATKDTPYKRDQSPFVPLVIYGLFLLIVVLSLLLPSMPKV